MNLHKERKSVREGINEGNLFKIIIATMHSVTIAYGKVK